MKVTLKQIDKELRDIAENHVQINSYFFGEQLDIQEANALTNCTLFANVLIGKLNKNTVEVDLILAVMDKISNGKGNLLDVESDTLQILNDVYQVIRYSNRWQSVAISTDISNFQKLYEETDSIMGGWSATINLKVKGSEGVCNTAFNSYDFDNGLFGC